MEDHAVVSREEWLEARLRLMAQEKQFTRTRESLARARRALPWVKIDKDYRFAAQSGEVGLADLFAGRSQLIVYHFMFGPGWEQGCPACTFWADNYDGAVEHLRQRDIELVAVSRGPLERLLAYRERMGWGFNWVSSAGSDFNADFAVSFDQGDDAPAEPNYNFGTITYGGEEAPGLSVFLRNDDGEMFHTYSCYARGLDAVNGAYQMMDLAPRGRDEAGLDFPMAWVRRRHEYES